MFDFEKFQATKNAPDAEVPTPDGSLFIGDKGMITTGTYGEETRLIPVEKMRDYQFPQPVLARSPGHYRDWIQTVYPDRCVRHTQISKYETIRLELFAFIHGGYRARPRTKLGYKRK